MGKTPWNRCQTQNILRREGLEALGKRSFQSRRKTRSVQPMETMITLVRTEKKITYSIVWKQKRYDYIRIWQCSSGENARVIDHIITSRGDYLSADTHKDLWNELTELVNKEDKENPYGH